MNASRGKRRFLVLLCLVGVLVFSTLGVWQVERRAWKLDLIARVNARVNAPAVAAPTQARWGKVNSPDDEYRRVRASGIFLNDRETLVDALTERGPGFWVMTPLRTGDGTVLINRGLVPPERKSAASRSTISGPVTVTGLLRMSEPNGRIFRANRPAEDLWYSRDIAAIARKRGLQQVAPFFIDADATPNAGGYPVGGMTVVSFRNMHLIYAITWFGLAALCMAGLVVLFRREP